VAIFGASISLHSCRYNVHTFCSRRGGMTQKPEKEAVAQHVVELRRAAVSTLRRFNKIADQLNFYQRYLAISKDYDVTFSGRFIIIKGGRSTETIRARPASESKTPTTVNLRKVR
jgi:hypothetical protein